MTVPREIAGVAYRGELQELRPAAAAEEGLPVDVYEAAYDGDAQAVAAWLDEGGGLDARCGENGVTLLMAAGFGGQEAMVRMLLRRGASVNLQDSYGITALTTTVSA